MGRFCDEAFAGLIDFNAIVDKFVGDEVIGIFIPAYSGRDHARHALDAARRLLAVTGHGRNERPIPIGIGVHSGVAFVGSVGQGPDTELTAMGDAVNVAARLAGTAGPGEILVTACGDHRWRRRGWSIDRCSSKASRARPTSWSWRRRQATVSGGPAERGMARGSHAERRSFASIENDG